jgi:hypothetical protein
MNARWLLGCWLLGVVALAGPGSARAEQPPPGDPTAPPDPSLPTPVEPGTPVDPAAPPVPPPQAPATFSPEVRTEPEAWRPRTGFGAAVLLGGGVQNFTDDTIDGITGVGGSWNLRLVSGTREPVGFELGYFGDAHDVTGPGITEDDFVLRTGLEAALRLQIPIVIGSGLLQPFGLGGLGWSQYSLLNESPGVTFMRNSDNQLAIPLGAGLAWSYRGFMLDARFTYRFAIEDELFGDRDMAFWNVGASAGAEF